MCVVTNYLILDIIILIFTILLGFYVNFKINSRKYWAVRRVPYEEPSFLLGNTKDASRTKTLSRVLDEFYFRHKEKNFFGIWLYSRPALLLFDVKLIKNVLVKDFSHFHDRGITVNEELEPLTGHLFNMSGQKWRNLRVKLTPAFTSGKMKMMYETMHDVAVHLQNFLNTPASIGETIEVKEILACFTTDVIASCVFGIETNSLENPDTEFRKNGRIVINPPIFYLISSIVQFTAPWVQKIIPLKQMPPDAADFFIKVVRDVIAYREANNEKRKDFMELIIELKTKGKVEDADYSNVTVEGGDPFTFEQAAAQAFVFFFAGFETSSTTMMLALYELACNPDIQARLQEEIDNTLAKENGKLSYNAIQEMTYLDQVVQETLRKYPVVPILFRECTKEYQIPDTDILLKEGEFLMIPISAIQNDPENFPDPEKFDPDRFSPEMKATRDNFLQLYFGSGPRICIGMRFGLLQVKIGLAMILSKFRFEVAETTPVPLILDPKQFFPCPRNGMPLKIFKR